MKNNDIQDFIIPITGNGDPIDVSVKSKGLKASNYRVKKLKKGLKTSRNMLNSKKLLFHYRSPRFIEKKNDSGKKLKKLSKKRNKIHHEYFKILHHKSKSRSNSKNHVIKNKFSKKTKEETLAVKMEKKNRVMNTIHGAMAKHTKHQSDTSSIFNGCHISQISHDHGVFVSHTAYDKSDNLDQLSTPVPKASFGPSKLSRNVNNGIFPSLRSTRYLNSTETGNTGNFKENKNYQKLSKMSQMTVSLERKAFHKRSKPLLRVRSNDKLPNK